MIQPRRKFMEAAIKEAIRARELGDYAIGAVVVRDGKIIARSTNGVKTEKDPTQHAEVAAIRKATKALNSQYLEGCILYTTHEPCPMCTSAAIWAKMKGIVFGSTMKDIRNYGLKNGNDVYAWRTIEIPASEVVRKGNPRISLVECFMRDECRDLFHC